MDYDSLMRSSSGPILYLIRENFNSILKNYLDNTKQYKSISLFDLNPSILYFRPYHKLFIYSGHDSTLIPLAMAFEVCCLF
jgi:hypothetical protein